MEPQSVFTQEILVPSEAIDANGHVNNLVYMHWFLQAAQAHAESAGWGEKACEAMGAMWVAKRHTIDYHHPAFVKEKLILKTWIESVERVKSIRRYRLEKADGTIVCSGETIWVFVDRQSLRPKRIPEAMAESFL